MLSIGSSSIERSSFHFHTKMDTERHSVGVRMLNISFHGRTRANGVQAKEARLPPVVTRLDEIYFRQTLIGASKGALVQAIEWSGRKPAAGRMLAAY